MKDDFYDIDSKPIVTLEAFYGPKKYIADKCIIIFSGEIYKNILERFNCEIVTYVGGCNWEKPIYSFVYNNEKVLFYLSELGSSLAGGNIEEINHITGATKFVMFGSCGSLDREATKGKFVIPTETYRGDGLSFYYAKASEYLPIKNSNKVAEIFKENHIPFVQGRNWTTESMIRETVNLVNKRKQEGCITVEMELAGVEAVCDFNEFDLYDFLSPGDVLSEEYYDTSELHNANHRLDMIDVALLLIKKI